PCRSRQRARHHGPDTRGAGRDPCPVCRPARRCCDAVLMPAPNLTTTGQFLWDEVGVAQPGDDTRGWPARLLVSAVARALGPLADLVRDTDERIGWADALNPDKIPAFALPWLAQFAGVTLTAGLTE